MKIFFKSWSLIFLVFSLRSWARPEYAMKMGTVNCMTCHLSPLGGSLRNLTGKSFGSHGLSQVSQIPYWFSYNSRMLLMKSRNKTESRSGFLQLTNQLGASMPVIESNDSDSSNARFVVTYGLGVVEQGLGESYFQYNMSQTENIFFNVIQVGRFQSPFGLLTDEHRTFTRVASRTGNYSYEDGLVASHSTTDNFHFSVALTQGIHSSSGSATDNASPWATFFNFRWIPVSQFLFGLSRSEHGSTKLEHKLEANSLYGGLDLQRLSLSIPVQMFWESLWTRGWSNSDNNPLLNFNFGFDGLWQNELIDARSYASMFLLNYDWSPTFVGQIKYETFVPNLRRPEEIFNRTGVGFRKFLTGNMNLTTRFEVSKCTRAGLTESSTSGGVSNFAYLMLHISL